MEVENLLTTKQLGRVHRLLKRVEVRAMFRRDVQWFERRQTVGDHSQVISRVGLTVIQSMSLRAFRNECDSVGKFRERTDIGCCSQSSVQYGGVGRTKESTAIVRSVRQPQRSAKNISSLIKIEVFPARQLERVESKCGMVFAGAEVPNWNRLAGRTKSSRTFVE